MFSEFKYCPFLFKIIFITNPVSVGGINPPPSYPTTIGTTRAVVKELTTTLGWYQLFTKSDAVLTVRIAPTSNFEVLFSGDLRHYRSDGSCISIR